MRGRSKTRNLKPSRTVLSGQDLYEQLCERLSALEAKNSNFNYQMVMLKHSLEEWTNQKNRVESLMKKDKSKRKLLLKVHDGILSAVTYESDALSECMKESVALTVVIKQTKSAIKEWESKSSDESILGEILNTFSSPSPRNKEEFPQLIREIKRGTYSLEEINVMNAEKFKS